MCRLFGFRSVIPSQVHRSLLDAENALGMQSQRHPDGWGVAFYVEGVPHLVRSPITAYTDQIFQSVSGAAASQTVLAHVRLATQGSKTLLNCHPFQYGRWCFAHNGDIPNFHEKYRERLLEEVAPRLRRFILGDTDSEVLFHILLTKMEAISPLSRRHDIEEVTRALAETIKLVRAIVDPPDTPPLGPYEQGRHALLTCLITDGEVMAATQGGKDLLWSTYKKHCPERQECPSLSAECEAPSKTGFVNHLLFSSEVLLGENIWQSMEIGEIVGVSSRMKMYQGHINRDGLSVAKAEVSDNERHLPLL